MTKETRSKKKPGPVPMKPGEAREVIVNFRARPAERELITEAGRIFGGASGLLRNVILPACKSILSLTAKDAK